MNIPQPATVWTHFLALVQVPRPSKQEAAAIEFLQQWAARLGLEARKDTVGNLVVHVPSTQPNRQSPAVILQCHVDIVAVTADGTHGADAALGKIPLVRGDLDANNEKRLIPNDAGDWINAPYTTLGADNGIGVAMMMALAEADHRPVPLQLLFTVDEEAGMTGAAGLDPSMLGLNGKIMINIDTEDDTEITIGAAGGRDVELHWQGTRQASPTTAYYQLSLNGLKGGHSGIEINQGRANANRLVARALHGLASQAGAQLGGLVGGSRRNAIPDRCTAHLFLAANTDAAAKTLVANCNQQWQRLYANRDNAIALRLEPCDQPPPATCLTNDSTQALARLMCALPTGIFEMTPEIPVLVEASCNMAIVELTEPLVKIICSVRGTTAEALDNLCDTVQSVACLAGAKTKISDGYPGWKPQLESPLLRCAIVQYEHQVGNRPKVHAVHAGLECGLLLQKMPGLDTISIGPTIKGNHAVGERVQISSVARSYAYLQSILDELGKL